MGFAIPPYKGEYPPRPDRAGFRRPDMKNLLKEYWLWITIPFVLVIGLLIAVWLLAGDGGASPFQYNVF